MLGGGAWWWCVVVRGVVVRGVVVRRGGGGACCMAHGAWCVVRGGASWWCVVVVRGCGAWWWVVVRCGAWWCVVVVRGWWCVVVRGGGHSRRVCGACVCTSLFSWRGVCCALQSDCSCGLSARCISPTLRADGSASSPPFTTSQRACPHGSREPALDHVEGRRKRDWQVQPVYRLPSILCQGGKTAPKSWKRVSK